MSCRWGAERGRGEGWGQGSGGDGVGGGGERPGSRYPSPRPRPATPARPAVFHSAPSPRQYADTTRCSYLEGEGPEGLGPLRYITLYHSADAGRGRGVYCLLLPAAARGLLVVVQPSALAQREVTPAALERAWRDGLGVLMPQGHNTQEQVGARAGPRGGFKRRSEQGVTPTRGDADKW
jgi:hypothetical protein